MARGGRAAAPDLRGYGGRPLELLRACGCGVGDTVRVEAGATYEGILMPRYEGAGGGTVVIKLASGYNAGVDAALVTGVEMVRRAGAPPAPPPAPAPREGLKRVLLLSTGGTIASSIDYRTGAVTPAATPEEIRASVPELAGIADIEARALLSEHSENLMPEHWKAIAEEIHGEAGAGYAGAIVAHGTDTMQYTASYLSFALRGLGMPVAMVGSQRSPDRPSSDAAINLAAAARLAAAGGARGVFVVMHRDGSDGEVACHAGTRARKNHTSRRGAFETVGGEPALTVSGGRVRGGPGPDLFGGAAYDPQIALDTRAALVKYHPGYDPGTLDHIVDSGARAVILEGTGLGHVGRGLHGAVGRAAERGVFVGMTSQCIWGRVNMAVYESGRDLMGMGVVPLGDMLPETALVKAMWALGRCADAAQVRALMLENVASEISG